MLAQQEMKPITHVLDAAAAGAVLGWFVGALPYVAALAGLIWYCIQIWESHSVQGALARWTTRVRSRRIAKLNLKVARAHRALKLAQERLAQLEPQGDAQTPSE